MSLLQIVKLDSGKILGAVGDAAHRVNFSEYIQKNIKLSELRNDLQMTTHAAANYTRGQVSARQQCNPLPRPLHQQQAVHSLGRCAVRLPSVACHQSPPQPLQRLPPPWWV